MAWCEENFIQFIGSHRWPPNSPNLNVLDYYVWDAITNHMQWNKVKNYHSLINEIKNGILHMRKNDPSRIVSTIGHTEFAPF